MSAVACANPTFLARQIPLPFVSPPDQYVNCTFFVKNMGFMEVMVCFVFSSSLSSTINTSLGMTVCPRIEHKSRRTSFGLFLVGTIIEMFNLRDGLSLFCLDQAHTLSLYRLSSDSARSMPSPILMPQNCVCGFCFLFQTRPFASSVSLFKRSLGASSVVHNRVSCFKVNEKIAPSKKSWS